MKFRIDGLIQVGLHICDVEDRKKPKPKVVFSNGLELLFQNNIDEKKLRVYTVKSFELKTFLKRIICF